MAISKPLLTKFGIHHRLESCLGHLSTCSRRHASCKSRQAPKKWWDCLGAPFGGWGRGSSKGPAESNGSRGDASSASGWANLTETCILKLLIISTRIGLRPKVALSILSVTEKETCVEREPWLHTWVMYWALRKSWLLFVSKYRSWRETCLNIVSKDLCSGNKCLTVW